VIYFDNNASTPISPVVRSAIMSAMEDFVGNPSSDHDSGRRIRQAVEQCRTSLGAWLKTDAESIVFTSGATEANSASILGATSRPKSARIITTPVEHPSVLRAVEYAENQGCEVHHVRVLPTGLLDVEHLEALVRSQDDVVAVQWANGETGVIQPVDKVIQLARAVGAKVHVDAAQAFGKVPYHALGSLPDYLSLSGHKIHAPAGVGALAASGDSPVARLAFGGEQERGRRAGTENWLGIIGLGSAITDRLGNWDAHVSKMRRLQDLFECGVVDRIPGAQIVGADSVRLPNTSNVLFRGVDGQALVAQLSARGVSCSQTSACSNHRPEPSYVLRAMGYSEEEAYSSVRFSFSPLNSSHEVESVLAHLEEISANLRSFI